MARPPLTCESVEVHVHLRLRRGEDDDLIAFFAQAAPRQRGTLLKSALRSGQMGSLTNASETNEAELADAIADFVF
jgi:hypothetical protein